MNKYLEELTQDGLFHIFAIDHRAEFSDILDEKLGYKASAKEIVEEKNRLMSAVKDYASGYLIDPVYSVGEDGLQFDLQGKNFMMGMENNNYNDNPLEGDYVYSGINPKKIKELGGKLVKLFVYYNPEMGFVDKLDGIVEDIIKDCKEAGIPFCIEPIMYSTEMMDSRAKVEMMVKSLGRLSKFDIDVYKLEFPGGIDLSEEENIENCHKVSAMLDVPWIILSSGGDYDFFIKQIQYSVQGGASGYAVGRSVWKNYVGQEDVSDMTDMFEAIVKAAKQAK